MAKKRQDDGTEIDTDEPEPKENVMAKVAAMLSPAPSADLVAMRKGGETLEVHPTTVKDHEKAGWEVA